MTSEQALTSPRSVALLRGTILRIALLATVVATTSTAIAGESGKGDSSPAGHLSSATSRLRQWFQTGQASWYGLKFQGRKTSSGELFNMSAFTCAHRSLPLGSWLRVTNLRNRKSVLVRVNDRGPMVDTRIIDLSYAAAHAVGIHGTAKVGIERVAPNDPEIARALMSELPAPTQPQLVPAR